MPAAAPIAVPPSSPIEPARSSDRHPGLIALHPVALGVISGVMLWTAFPPASWSWLGWIALVPLFLLATSRRSRRSIYLGAFIGGLIFWLLALNWILCIDASAAVGWVVMATVLALFWPIAIALARVGTIGLGLPGVVAIPIAWVALEYARAHFFTGFPWYYLAHTQYRMLPLIQVADFSGSLGLSLLMAGMNALFADAMIVPLLRPTPRGPRPTRAILVRAVPIAAALILTAAYGAFRLGTARFTPGPRVALLQSNLMQRVKMGKSGEEIYLNYLRLIEKASASTPRPELIVWPETAYPFGFVSLDPALPREAHERQVREINAEAKAEYWGLDRNDMIHGQVDELKIPMMIGATTYDFRAAGLARYNSAILVEPGKLATRSYHKIHLVPFGEYVPLLGVFPWIAGLGPYRNGYIPNLNFGPDPAWFDVGSTRYATAICFEDTVPQVVRRLIGEVPDGRTPDVLLNLSNDGWFATQDADGTTRGSSEHEMHLAVSAFRAVEHRIPLARAANTGISAVIDGNGRVVESLPAAKEGVLIAAIPLDPRTGLSTILGDWVGLGCLAVTVGLPFVKFGRSRFRRAKRPDIKAA